MHEAQQPGNGAAGAPPPTLVDTHCHLTYGELGKDPDRYLEQARAAGVATLVLIGIDAASSQTALDYASGHDGVYCALGIHPNSTAKAGAGELDEISALLEHPKVVALGETGLDFYWDEAPREVQERSLERHVELALERDLPLVLHIRDAYGRAAEVLRSSAVHDGLRAIVHCFGGQAREVDPFLDWGWPISFSGILTLPKATNVHDAARRVPLDLCLVETDAPWLTPFEERGKTNQPAFVVHTARHLATIKGVAFQEIARATTANAASAFRWESAANA